MASGPVPGQVTCVCGLRVDFLRFDARGHECIVCGSTITLDRHFRYAEFVVRESDVIVRLRERRGTTHATTKEADMAAAKKTVKRGTNAKSKGNKSKAPLARKSAKRPAAKRAGTAKRAGAKKIGTHVVKE